MRRKANLKKFMAFLLSAVMLLSLCTTVFAETPGNSGESETNPVVCQVTEGCTLENGHEGECVVESDKGETKTKENLQDDETEEESTEKTGENETSEVVSEAVQDFLFAVDAIVIPGEINDETGPALNEQIGVASDAYEALSAEDLEREDVQAAVLIMQTAMNALTGGAITIPSMYNPVTIQARVVCASPSWTEIFLGGNDKAYAGSGTESYQAYYTIPPLDHFLAGTAYEGYNYGRVTKVVSSYHLPAGGEAQVGQNVEFGTNKSVQTITYWVSSWSASSYMWNFELKFDANGGNGEPDTLTYGTNDTYTKSHTFTIPGTQPVRSGYNFKGWSETADSTKVCCQPNGTYTVRQTVSGYGGGSASKTLYAVWEKDVTYTVTYTDGVAGEEIFKDQVYSNLKSGTSTPTFSGTPERKGYTFKGWTPQVASIVTGNAIYTAVWEKKPEASDWSKLTIEKTATPSGTVKPGDTVTYTISVTNGTGRALKDITVSEKLNENLTFVSVDPAGQYDASTGVWTIASLANGAKAQLTISATVKEGVADGTVISNTAAITDAGTDDDENEKLPDGTKPEDKADVTVTNPVVNPPTITIHYCDKDGNPLADDVTVKANDDGSYDVTNEATTKIIDGWVFDYADGELTGKITDNIEIQLTMTKMRIKMELQISFKLK